MTTVLPNRRTQLVDDLESTLVSARGTKLPSVVGVTPTDSGPVANALALVNVDANAAAPNRLTSLRLHYETAYRSPNNLRAGGPVPGILIGNLRLNGEWDLEHGREPVTRSDG